MHLKKHATLVLRIGLAFVFGIFAVDKIFQAPLHVAWFAWIPPWLSFIPQNLFLYGLGAVEFVLALMLIGGKFVRLAALACATFLLGVVLSFGINEITVRDIGLIAMALALAMLPEQNQYHELQEIQRLVHKKRRVK
jgi:uncharacterized membrane protein YphA (DoxX/SURF4 family)